MSEKRGDGGAKVLGAAAAFGAAFAARKIITIVWKQVTGKEPPSDPHDPRVGIGEALGWAVITGVGIETARLLAVRFATKRLRQPAGQED
jgi:hypothetical protein